MSCIKYIAYLLVAAICLAGCSEPNKPDDHAGGGIPIPNPSVVSGAVSFGGWAQGKEGVKTVLYRNIIDSTDIRSWPVDTAYTDSTGSFGFDTLDVGCYSIVFEKGTYKAFSGYFNYTGDTIILDTSYLSPALAIAGHFHVGEDRIDCHCQNGYQNYAETENLLEAVHFYSPLLQVICFQFFNPNAGQAVVGTVSPALPSKPILPALKKPEAFRG